MDEEKPKKKRKKAAAEGEGGEPKVHKHPRRTISRRGGARASARTNGSRSPTAS